MVPGQERAAGADGAAGIAGVARFAHLLTSARLLRAEGRHREALGLLEELREETEASGRTGDLIDVLTLQALALWEGSKRVRAVGTLAEAMELAEPEGYVRTFVDEGPPMADILSGMLEAQQREVSTRLSRRATSVSSWWCWSGTPHARCRRSGSYSST